MGAQAGVGTFGRARDLWRVMRELDWLLGPGPHRGGLKPVRWIW